MGGFAIVNEPPADAVPILDNFQHRSAMTHDTFLNESVMSGNSSHALLLGHRCATSLSVSLSLSLCSVCLCVSVVVVGWLVVGVGGGGERGHSA